MCSKINKIIELKPQSPINPANVINDYEIEHQEVIIEDKFLTKLNELDRATGSEHHQTDVLFSRAFTEKVDQWLLGLDESDKAEITSYLRSNSSSLMYYHDTHDYSKEPFDEDGYCCHGLDVDTCPAGCGAY